MKTVEENYIDAYQRISKCKAPESYFQNTRASYDLDPQAYDLKT